MAQDSGRFKWHGNTIVRLSAEAEKLFYGCTKIVSEKKPLKDLTALVAFTDCLPVNKAFHKEMEILHFTLCID